MGKASGRGFDQDAADAAAGRALREAIQRAGAIQELTQVTPLEQVIDLIVRTAVQAIPSPEGALFIVDVEQRVLTFDTVIGSTAATVLGTTVPMGHGIAGLVAVSGQPLAVADAQSDPRHARDVAERSRYFPTSILAVPVIAADGSVIGVLELLDRQGQSTYDLRDMELLGYFAGLVASVLEQRQMVSTTTVLVAHALEQLTGVSADATRAVVNQLGIMGDSDAGSRTNQLAELVARVVSRGAAEQSACVAILTAFDDYARAGTAGEPDGEWAY